MEKINNVVFVRKPDNLQEVVDTISDVEVKDLKKHRKKVVVVKEKFLDDKEFKEVAENLREDRDWITKDDAGFEGDREKVILVENKKTREEFFIRTEGYAYPRYVGVGI